MNTKREKLIYWLLGLGTGMVISSMVMLGIALKMVDPIDKVMAEAMPKTIKVNDVVASEKEAEVKVKQDELEEIAESETQWISVEIPAHYGSDQIAYLLEEKEVVEDGKEFLEYIQKQKKTKFLQHGVLQLPIKGQYNEILDILLTPNQ